MNDGIHAIARSSVLFELGHPEGTSFAPRHIPSKPGVERRSGHPDLMAVSIAWFLRRRRPRRRGVCVWVFVSEVVKSRAQSRRAIRQTLACPLQSFIEKEDASSRCKSHQLFGAFPGATPRNLLFSLLSSSLFSWPSSIYDRFPQPILLRPSSTLFVPTKEDILFGG